MNENTINSIWDFYGNKNELKDFCDNDLDKYLRSFMPSKFAFDHRTVCEGSYILRGRMNKDDGTPFTSQKEISYNPNPGTIYGRANKKGQPMWYGSYNRDDLLLKDAESMGKVLATIFGEMKEYKEHDGKCFDFTIGEWKVKKCLQLVNILMPDTPKFKEFVECLYKKIECTETRKKIIDMTIFMAAEFAKNVKNDEDYNYKLTAVFTDIILNIPLANGQKEKYFDGIIYPTTQTVGEGKEAGLSIALTPSAVDRCLELETAFCHEAFNKKGAKDYGVYQNHKMSTTSLGKDNSCFIWKENPNFKKV